MLNLDLTFEEVLEEYFSENKKINEQRVSKFCLDILSDFT
jgi:hypothetical protein